MRTPAENGIGYNTSSVLHRIAKFDAHYLLVHGDAALLRFSLFARSLMHSFP